MEELKNATGMKFEHYQRSFLEKRISFRMKHLELDYYDDYINYIRKNPEEINLFLDKFTINYTYFFRNYNVFENFEKFINVYIDSNQKTLRIWSAPCATGDEPYTIAMVLDQLKRKNKNFPDFKIIASDIDSAVLKIAKQAVYGEYSLHETPEIYKKNYFSMEYTEFGPKFILSKDISEKVEFIQEDIIKGHQRNQKYDVIFCRNFLIYINQFAREKLLRILESHLIDGGLLILGGSESLTRNNNSFETISIRERFYVKNLFTQNSSYKNRLINLFKNNGTSNLERNRALSKTEDLTNKNEIKNFKVKPKIKEKRLEVPNPPAVFEQNLEKPLSQLDQNIQELNEREMMEAELRIIGIEVNNGFNKDSYENIKNQKIDPMKKPVDKIKKFSNDNRANELKQKENILEQREKKIEQVIAYLDKKHKRIKRQSKEIKQVFKSLKQKELEVKNRVQILERLTKQVERRKKILEQKEKQFESRLRQIGDYTRQVAQQEVQMNGISKEITKSKEEDNLYELKRIDRIEKKNNKSELIIPMGYYGLINSFDKNDTATKFVIEGIGSGIALILKDPIHNIFTMSNISLPSSSASKQGYHLLFPHTFVDTSVKDLYNTLIYHGANKDNISALIVGGAKLFLDYDITYQENIDAIKNELEIIQIPIEAEDIGGLSERAVIYDTINDILYVKKSWEFEYRKIS
ncbi:MAG: CheR family methyltransferase [Candidatus Hermodarchaeota archaeon]